MEARLPAGIGLGFRFQHASEVLNNKPHTPWFEVIADDLLLSSGRQRVVEKIRQDYPIALHAVGLNINKTVHFSQLRLKGDILGVIHAGLSYKVNNKLSFSFYGEITQAEQTNPTFLFLNRAAPSVATNLGELAYNNKKSFTSNDLTLENPTQNYRVEMDYKLSDAWQSQTLLSKSSTSTKGYYTYLYDFGGTPDITFSRYLNKQNANTQTTDIQQNFIGNFDILGLRNRMVVGVDYLNTTITDNGTGYVYYGSVTPDGTEEAGYPLSTAGVDAALQSAGVNNSKSEYSIFSVYASDVLNLTKSLSAMVGLRLDRFDNKTYDQTTFSPKFGLLYQPILDKLSIFGNYQNGFTNVAPQLVGDVNAGPQTLKTFDPEQANQLEFGVKANLFNNRFNATISYYDIKVKDKLMTDPDSPFNKIQGGEVESKGFEVEINANPVNGLNIRAGFSNNDSEVIRTDNTNILNRNVSSRDYSAENNKYEKMETAIGAMPHIKGCMYTPNMSDTEPLNMFSKFQMKSADQDTLKSPVGSQLPIIHSVKI